MKTAIILHGMRDEDEPCTAMSNKHWIPWLQEQLICHDILAQTPEFPHATHPSYEEWAKVFAQFTVDENTHLIGHSCGAGFLIRFLSENKVKVGKVILVAPWMDPREELKNDFFTFTTDKTLAERTLGVTVFLSADDDLEMKETLIRIETTVLQVARKDFIDKGHFTEGDMGTNEFPELLQAILE